MTVEEPLWRLGSRTEGPFSTRAEVSCRGCSLPLQRVLTDFGADEPFGRVPDKLREHYGIDLPVSAIQRVTEGHAQRCLAWEAAREIVPPKTAAATLIGEIDGSMVPVGVANAQAEDKRRGKTVQWQDARLCLAHAVGSATPVFGGHFAGGVEESGRHWRRCAIQAGFGPASRLHAVGDGAPWIADQVEAQFGAQGRYLIDFYHLGEYLGEAAKVVAANDPVWVEVQQERLKANRVAAVRAELAPFIEADPDAPVAACDRYLHNRLAHLDYQGALVQGLPIGSGEIESAHRYIIQARLKRPGAWWTPTHLEAMLALRLNRANHRWQTYWQELEKKTA